jgi:NCAIR mutase (PurE)-related protein
MHPDRIAALLGDVKAGTVSVDAAVRELAALPYADLGFANVDTHRHLRLGFPEVVYGHGKTREQMIQILNVLRESGGNVLATRVRDEDAAAIVAAVTSARHVAVANSIVVEQQPIVDRGVGEILVVSAGTSDQRVAEEAALTAQVLGNRVERVFDVGVAGLHRLLARRDVLLRANVVVVVAGMEGALPSVVGGLVRRPVIAVPTSVGYGANFGGLSALLGMLNSCASGVTVVNIDNGFGAGYAAALMNRKPESP